MQNRSTQNTQTITKFPKSGHRATTPLTTGHDHKVPQPRVIKKVPRHQDWKPGKRRSNLSSRIVALIQTEIAFFHHGTTWSTGTKETGAPGPMMAPRRPFAISVRTRRYGLRHLLLVKVRGTTLFGNHESGQILHVFAVQCLAMQLFLDSLQISAKQKKCRGNICCQNTIIKK